MAFDQSGNLYATAAFGPCFGAGQVFKFDNSGTLIGPFGSGYSTSTESITLDAPQNVYVGQPDGTRQILKFNSAGAPLASFSPMRDNRGTDWIDLAADQCTMFYTSEGANIRRFNVCTNMQLPNFCTSCGGVLYALRIRSNGEILVADGPPGAFKLVRRFNSSGSQIQSYSAAGLDFPFAANLDPDGTSFWTADYSKAQVFRIDLTSGSVITQFNAGKVGCCLSGLAIFGEPVVGQPPAPGPSSIPTLSEWSLIIMALILATTAVAAVQRRRT
jgi:DNA-binding beta-propeller fold protein YncE